MTQDRDWKDLSPNYYPDFLVMQNLKEAARGSMRNFLEDMREVDPTKKHHPVLCSQAGCVKAATWTYFFPGKRHRLLACDLCMARARRVVDALGIEPTDKAIKLTQMPAIDVQLDLSKAKADDNAGILDVVPEFVGAKLAVIEISSAEVHAIVFGGGVLAYPVRELWIRFAYMGELCVVSCPNTNPEDTSWVGEESKRDYMEAHEPNFIMFNLAPDERFKFTVETDTP